MLQQAQSTRGTVKRVPFTVRMENADSVAITGDFTDWSEDGIPLTRGGRGEWKTTLGLAPGEYQYRLRVDGRWSDHSEAPKRVPNGLGGENCVLTVA